MENLPYNDFEQLIQLLQATYSGDNNQVKAATQVFKQMSADFTHFLDSMMMVIMTDNNTQEFIKVKNAACLIFTSFLPQVIDGNNYPLEKKNYIANAIITAMCSDKVALTQKLTLQAVLRKMYNKDMSAYLRNQGLLFVKEKLSSENIHEFATALLVFQGIVNTPETTRQAIAEWLVSLRSFIMSAGDNLVNGIVSEINQFMQGTDNQQDKISSISIGLKTLKIWVSLIQDCLQILRKPDEKTRLVTNFIEVIVNEESIVKLFSNILALQVPNDKQIQQCLISTSGFVEIDQPLNALKTIVLKAFNRFLETLVAGKSLLDFTKTKFYDFIKDDGVKGILNSVFLLCKSEELNIDEILKDRSLNDCLVECLIHLTHLTMFSHFNDIFSDYNKQLLQDICLPLMRSEEHELALFFDNHLQFVYLGVDVCNKQESQTVKTQAAQLLESICDNTHGALSYLVVLVCNIIEYSLIYGTPDQATQAHDTLDLRCKIISQTDPVKRVETCLLALGPISYLVAERSDLVGFLEQLLTKYQTFFLGEKSDPIIKARVCLLFGYYCDALFQEEEKYDMFVLYLKFVVECIGLQTPEYGALSNQAIDSLAFIFRQEEMNQKMVNFIDEILERLLAYAKTTNFVKLFEIFEEINDEYRQNLKRNPTLLAAFLSTLTARAQLEYENAKQNKRNNRIILTKIWNIFRGIAENRLFIPVFQEDIEKIISPLFAYLCTEEKVIFEEDIIKYMIAVIKCAKTVSPLCWEIFKAFPKIFMRAQTISSLLFMALNLTIVYGRNVLENDPGAIKTLVDMGIHTLTYCKSKGDEVFVAKGALLLQLVLQYFDKISEEDWNRILGVCIDKIFQAHKGFVKSRLGGVVLCAFLRKFELTQAILINKNALTGILDLFLKNTLIFNAHPYDRKLLIIGLSSFLPQRNVHQTAYQRYPELLNVLVSLLKYVQFLDDKNANKNKNIRGGPVGLVDEEEAILRNSSVLERFLHDTPEGAVLDKREDENLINSENYFSPAREEEKDENDTRDKDDEDEEDDEDSDNDNFFNDYSDQAEANIIVDKLETELKVKDEFTIFKEALHEMKAIGETVIMELVNRLSSEKKEFLREIMQSQRVAIDESGGKTETRRIVKPRTRKIATNIGKNQD